MNQRCDTERASVLFWALVQAFRQLLSVWKSRWDHNPTSCPPPGNAHPLLLTLRRVNRKRKLYHLRLTAGKKLENLGFAEVIWKILGRAGNPKI